MGYRRVFVSRNERCDGKQEIAPLLILRSGTDDEAILPRQNPCSATC